jgi:hypothetical protein
VQAAHVVLERRPRTQGRDCGLGSSRHRSGCTRLARLTMPSHPIADGLPTRKPSETSSSPLAQGNPAAAAYAPRARRPHERGQGIRSPCRRYRIRVLRARPPDCAWVRRAVGEGVMSCPRAGSDLGGSDRLSAMERALVEGFAGAAVTLQHLNAQLALASLSLDGLRGAPPFAAKAPPCVPGAGPPAGRRSCA